MKEKITLKVVRDLTRGFCHLVVPVKLLIPEEILYDVVRAYKHNVMRFNAAKVYDDETVDKLLERSVNIWSNSRKEEVVRCLVVSYSFMQDPCPGKLILRKDVIRCLQYGGIFCRLYSISDYIKDDICCISSNSNIRIEGMSVRVDTSEIFANTDESLTRLVKGLYHLTKWNKLE